MHEYVLKAFVLFTEMFNCKSIALWKCIEYLPTKPAIVAFVPSSSNGIANSY